MVVSFRTHSLLLRLPLGVLDVDSTVDDASKTARILARLHRYCVAMAIGTNGSSIDKLRADVADPNIVVNFSSDPSQHDLATQPAGQANAKDPNVHLCLFRCFVACSDADLEAVVRYLTSSIYDHCRSFCNKLKALARRSDRRIPHLVALGPPTSVADKRAHAAAGPQVLRQAAALFDVRRAFAGYVPECVHRGAPMFAVRRSHMWAAPPDSRDQFRCDSRSESRCDSRSESRCDSRSESRCDIDDYSTVVDSTTTHNQQSAPIEYAIDPDNAAIVDGLPDELFE